MTYEFRADGVLMRGRMSRSHAVAVGTPVSIGYMPGDRGENWAIGYEGAGTPSWAGPISSLVPLLMVSIAVSNFRRRLRLLANGQATIARSTGVSRTLSDRGGRRYRWQVEFRDLGSIACTATFETRREAPPANTEIVIVYDTNQPKRAMLYPDRMVQISLS